MRSIPPATATIAAQRNQRLVRYWPSLGSSAPSGVEAEGAFPASSKRRPSGQRAEFEVSEGYYYVVYSDSSCLFRKDTRFEQTNNLSVSWLWVSVWPTTGLEGVL